MYKDNLGREVIGRRVTKEDQQGINEMSETIFLGSTGIGYDYLPTYFSRWCQAPNRQMTGLEIDGKLVSFSCYTALDNGKTRWSEGLRVHHNYRNQGLNYLQSDVNSFFYQPPDAYIRSRTAIGKEVGTLDDAKEYIKTNPQCKLLDLRHHFCTSTASSTLSFFNENSNRDMQRSFVSATPLEVHKFIETNPFLFPEKGVCLDWVFYDATLELLETIHRGEQALIPFEYFLGKQNNQVTSFCATGILPRTSGTFYEISFYGKDFSSFQQVLAFLRPKIEKLALKQEINYLTIWLSDHLRQSKEAEEFISKLGKEILYRRSCFVYQYPRIIPAKL